MTVHDLIKLLISIPDLRLEVGVRATDDPPDTTKIVESVMISLGGPHTEEESVVLLYRRD